MLNISNDVLKPSRFRILGLHFYAAITIALIFLHQGIIASSAYFLTSAIEELQRGAPFNKSLMLYLSSMIVPFAPGCLSYVTMQAWANAAHERLIESFKKSYQGKSCIYRDEGAKDSVDSVISRNSFPATLSYISNIHGLTSFALNSALSLAVISFLLPSDIWLGYLISAIGCTAVIGLMSPGISRLSKKSQEHLASYGYFLGKSWANITLGNTYNQRKWEEKISSSGAKYYKIMMQLTRAKQLSNFFLGLVTLIPTAYLIYHTVKSPQFEPSLVAATIVNLTRIFHILNSLGALVYQCIEFGSADAAVKQVLHAIMPSRSLGDSAENQDPRGISINGVMAQDLPTIRTDIRSAERGRFTVRGPNGSGKTTFLLSLKSSDPHRTFYLPASIDQLMWPDGFDNLSTGERMMKALGEIQNLDEINMLLLDEWDANLDETNTQLADELLDTLARTKVVVEVRH